MINTVTQGVLGRNRSLLVDGLLRPVDVTDCLEKPDKTCQNNLWFCKHSQKGRNRTVRSFFQPKLQVFPHSERI